MKLSVVEFRCEFRCKFPFECKIEGKVLLYIPVGINRTNLDSKIPPYLSNVVVVLPVCRRWLAEMMVMVVVDCDFALSFLLGEPATKLT